VKEYLNRITVDGIDFVLVGQCQLQPTSIGQPFLTAEAGQLLEGELNLGC